VLLLAFAPRASAQENCGDAYGFSPCLTTTSTSTSTTSTIPDETSTTTATTVPTTTTIFDVGAGGAVQDPGVVAVPLARTGTSSTIPSVVVALGLVTVGFVLVKTQRRHA
jgi:hypothetical protein